MTLATGHILNHRYRIVRLVGQGGFGAVYRAWDMSLARPVAVKENTDTGDEAQRQFEREAKLLADLRHPNLPVVIDHFVLPDQGQYLVMDFVEGRSLAVLQAERGGPLEEAEVWPWIRQVCDALTYLHARTPPIIHRDIKPGNIILTSDGRAVLVDFGISKIYNSNQGTTIGARAVTPGYSPPEQYGTGRTDARSDVYALGATLYMLLTGQLPPDGPDLASGADVLVPPRQLNPAVSEATSAAVMAAMTPNISQRLSSIEAFNVAMSGRAPTPANVARPGTGPGVGQQRWQFLPVAIGAVALIAVLIAGALWLARRGADTPLESAVATATTPAVAAVATTAPTLVPSETPTAQPSPTPNPSPTPLPEATPTTAPPTVDSRILPLLGGIGVEQVYVPGGTFTMGSQDGKEDELPLHDVTLDGFWLDRTEVTNQQFAAFVGNTGYETLAEREGVGGGFTTAKWGNIREATWQQPMGPGSSLDGLDDHPVVQVAWEDAQAYCQWAGGRLPTEAEWEYAARGPDAGEYPWGDAFDSARLSFCDRSCFLEQYADRDANDGFVLTAPVGSFAEGASWVGAVDMAGNVWEWTADWYGAQYYATAPELNPPGPESGEQRVIRGGAWDDTYDFVRSAKRYTSAPEKAFNYLGFRCVQ